MLRSEWDQIRHFSIEENWGNPSLMKMHFVQTLDQFRDLLGVPMVLSCGTGGEHTEHSLHYSGEAADVVFPDRRGRTLLDLFLDATRFEFTEIGVYPFWKLNGQVVGGLHLGRKPTTAAIVAHRKKLWLGIPSEKIQGQNVYLSASHSNLKRFGVI